MQNILKGTINPDQLAFFPLRYVLDNILLQYQTIEWVKDSNQDLIFLELDFAKAYDVVC